MTTLQEVYWTAAGAAIVPLLPRPDDDEVIPRPCVWCDGEGFAGGGCDQDELDANPSLMGPCHACGGAGHNGLTTRRALREEAFRDMVFSIDASRAALRDRDLCPDCGVCDCSNGGQYDCPQAPPVHHLVDAITGRAVTCLAVDLDAVASGLI